MNQAKLPELDELEQKLLRYSDEIAGAGPVLASQVSACAGLAIIRAVREFDKSSRRYGKILIWLTMVLVVLTAVLVWLTIVLIRHS